MQRAREGEVRGVLRVGTWNISGWGAAKMRAWWPELPVEVLAVQETHLAVIPLHWAHGTMRDLGGSLHHGHPVKAVGQGTFGRSCGVGFVARQGVALAPVLPVGSAWRWLHLVGRLHAVKLAPRAGLPKGLLLLSVYAPLQVRQQAVERRRFVEALQEVTSALDMQVPTLLMGDFNGSVCPPRDFQGESAGRREACPLLARLLGPGSAWVDLQLALMGEELAWTYQHLDREGRLSASRIDLVLVNHTALGLVCRMGVLSEVRDGGHSPVVVDLRIEGRASICWRQPQPRLPPLLLRPSRELQSSEDWRQVMARWEALPEVAQVLAGARLLSVSELSKGLAGALQHLVALAGGWVTRPAGRRAAYDSAAMREAQGRLVDLHRLETVTRPLGVVGLGSWPHSVEVLLGKLRKRGLTLPEGNMVQLRAAVLTEVRLAREEVARLGREMRKERYARWKDNLPGLWRDRPGVIHHWLQAPMAAWGTFPVLDEEGVQCTTAEEVDRAVRGFWVDQVLRQHAAVDGQERWARFAQSEFGAHIPRVEWQHHPWTGSVVRSVLGTMREGAAPGLPGVPIAVWKALPEGWMEGVARLLNLVEQEGRWPPEWLEAYVVMIPKANGGFRPRDQRPITVLPVLYRIWSKGVARDWAVALHREYLGQAALGFRAQAGTLHVAQLLSDIIAVRRRLRAELWLVSFDIEKCYDSIPWWALFGVMRRARVEEKVVGAFEAYYRGLRRRFRYGQVDGEVWQAANSLMQGCPAAPDQLNMLLEPFHRWALARGLGVEVAGRRVPSLSFADDVALVGRDRAEVEVLITAYLRWCDLLGLRVTKVQVWSNTGQEQELQVGGVRVMTVPLFRMVGVVLGEDERVATDAHFAPRLRSALATLQRLRTLELPSSLCSLLWRTDVLPKALYGCEVRNVLPERLVPLSSGGKAALGPKFPLRVNQWRAPEVLMGPPFGESGVRDPMLEARERQLRWLVVVCNLPGLVGEVHRAVAGGGRQWLEPNKALRAALKAVGWTVRRNERCHRAANWPVVLAEEGYQGEVLLQPVDDFPMARAVFTDGSVAREGGAAAVMPEEGQKRMVRVVAPRSSTQCELVALTLALEMQPLQVLTDSLAALTMLRNWGRWPPQRVLQSPDRVEVRRFLHRARELGVLPQVVKVKAHDEEAIRLGHPRAVGNDEADACARQAAVEEGHSVWSGEAGPHGDPVELLDGGGKPVLEVRRALEEVWWARRLRSKAQARPWLERLYPPDVCLDWAASTGVFRRPTVSGNTFVHVAHTAVVKWLARVRAGCLASRARLVKHGLEEGSQECLCCGAEVEDDEHILLGCAATGTLEWQATVEESWRAAATVVRLEVPMPSVDTLVKDPVMLLAALLPRSAAVEWGLPTAVASRFLGAFHFALAEALAERLRRREELIAASRVAAGPAGPMVQGSLEEMRPGGQGARGSGGLPQERRLTVADLRGLEQRRRQVGMQQQGQGGGVATSSVPLAGEPRRRWLRQRLVTLIREDMVVCPVGEGVPAVVVLELFERVTGEAFSDTPGARVESRVRGMGKVLGNLAREEGLMDPPLLQARRVLARNALVVCNRRPRVSRDVQAWRRSVEAAEAHSAPVSRLREQMAEADKGLAAWVKGHRYLVPTAVESGESGMALMLLWEVDHGRSFPSQGGGQGLAGALAGFSKRLQERATQDTELSQWLMWKEMHVPLDRGLAPSHHRRWSVRVVEPGPGEPRGWWEEFVARWKAFLGTLARPRLSRAGEISEEVAAQIRPETLRDGPMEVDGTGSPGRRAWRLPPVEEEGEAAPTPAKRPRVLPPKTPRKRPAPSAPAEARPLRRQRSLTGWLQCPRVVLPSEDDPPAPAPVHQGRAVEGPLT